MTAVCSAGLGWQGVCAQLRAGCAFPFCAVVGEGGVCCEFGRIEAVLENTEFEYLEIAFLEAPARLYPRLKTTPVETVSPPCTELRAGPEPELEASGERTYQGLREGCGSLKAHPCPSLHMLQLTHQGTLLLCTGLTNSHRPPPRCVLKVRARPTLLASQGSEMLPGLRRQTLPAPGSWWWLAPLCSCMRVLLQGPSPACNLVSRGCQGGGACLHPYR